MGHLPASARQAMGRPDKARIERMRDQQDYGTRTPDIARVITSAQSVLFKKR